MRVLFFSTLLIFLSLTGCTGKLEISILTQGAPLHGANGIRFDAQDSLHVASVFGSEIVRMNPEDGSILNRYGLESGIEGPDDLLFGPDGSMYWTAIVSGQVGRRWPDGRTEIIADVGIGVNPIAMSDDGRLVVARCFYGDGLYEIDPEGVEQPRVIIEALGGGCGFNAFDFGPDGFLYAPGFFRDEIMRVNIDSGERTLVASGFGTPNALKFDSQDRLHVLDTERGEVLRVDIDSGAKEVLAVLEPGLDNLAFDSRDRLFVSSASDSSIVEVQAGGAIRVVSRPGLSRPGGIASIGDSLWVADKYALVELDAQSGDTRSYQPSLISLSELSEPLTVSPFGDYLLLTSYFRNSVQVWDPKAEEAIATHHHLAMPLNAIGYRGAIAVAQGQSGSVCLLDKNGQTKLLADNFELPIGLAVWGDDLYVGDYLTGTITRITPEGICTEVVRDLSGPEGLAFTKEGALLIVETKTRRLLAAHPKTGITVSVAEELPLGLEVPPNPLTPPTLLYNGVTVAADGVVYLTGDVDNVVIRITPKFADFKDKKRKKTRMKGKRG